MSSLITIIIFIAGWIAGLVAGLVVAYLVGTHIVTRDRARLDYLVDAAIREIDYENREN
jgi:energy-converting hydrogenase Eha subunit A